NVNGTLFFRGGFDPVHGDELRRSDGTEAGTMLVKDIRPGTQGSGPEEFHNVNGVLMFLANDGKNGTQLWRSDGTAEGTVIFNPSAGLGFSTTGRGTLSVANDRLYFSANDGVNGFELWNTDGTASGTHRIDIRPGSQGSGPKGV